jgi:DNA-binding cell septation regulator SpoVG
MKVIKCSLNVSAINKDKLIQGKKGVYLNCTLLETPNSEFADYMIVEDVTKEERETGEKGAILGNGKVFSGGGEKVSEEAKNDLPW